MLTAVRRTVAVSLAVAGTAFAAAPALAASTTVTLQGTAAGFQPTGISVSPGHPIQLTATGAVDYGCHNINDCGTDPDGIFPNGGGPLTAGGGFAGPGLRAYSLVGRVGTGAPIQLGKGPVVISGSGPISIVYADNSGSYAVTLTDMAVDGSGGVGGSVPATLSLTLGTAPSFGAFVPGAARDYTASTTATVISTAGDATLSVADPSAFQTGHLVNGTFFLPQSLQARANTGTFAPVGSSAAPTSLLTYSAPVANDHVTLDFKQSIGAGDALRTGSYAKPLTFTLSTTTP
jgi:plastocyanin